MIYFPTNWGAKEPQNPPNHRVARIMICLFGLGNPTVKTFRLAGVSQHPLWHVGSQLRLVPCGRG